MQLRFRAAMRFAKTSSQICGSCIRVCGDDRTMAARNGAKRDLRCEAPPNSFGIVGKFCVPLIGFQECDRAGIGLRPVRGKGGTAGLPHLQQRQGKRRVVVEEPIMQTRGVAPVGICCRAHAHSRDRRRGAPAHAGQCCAGRMAERVAEKMKAAAQPHFRPRQNGPRRRVCVCVDQNQCANRLFRGFEPSRHFDGDKSTEGIAAEPIGTGRLQRVNGFHVVFGHFFDARQRRLSAVESARLDGVHGVGDADPPSECSKLHYRAANAVEDEKRTLRSTGFQENRG